MDNYPVNVDNVQPLIPPRSYDPCHIFVSGLQALNKQAVQNNVTETVKVYSHIGVVGVCNGEHMCEGEIRKPICAVAIPDRDLIAFIHNGRLISMVNCTSRQIIDTFIIRDPPNQPSTRGLRGEMVADNKDYLYLTSEGAVKIYRFQFSAVTDRSNVQPEVFASVPESDRYRCFRGMAISLSRQLFLTAFGRKIIGFSLADGSIMNRWELSSEEVQSALMQSAVDMQFGPGVPPKVFVILTTFGGSRVHGKMLNFEGEPDNTPFQQIGVDVSGGLGHIRHCAFDKIGNLICADSKRRLIHVFPPNVHGTVLSFAPCEDDEKTGEWVQDLKNETVARLFNPSGVAVLLDALSGRRSPMVVVPDFTLDALVFFAPEKYD